jgi:hypothetical protein
MSEILNNANYYVNPLGALQSMYTNNKDVVNKLDELCKKVEENRPIVNVRQPAIHIHNDAEWVSKYILNKKS